VFVASVGLPDPRSHLSVCAGCYVIASFE